MDTKKLFPNLAPKRKVGNEFSNPLGRNALGKTAMKFARWKKY